MLFSGPDTRIVELRVPGVLGATPESVTGAVHAVDVAGDGLGRIVRPADRMRRPVSGPVLQVRGRPVPRVIEGYVWAGMTSGGVGKAAWALLFPFSLCNVAHWMLPPVAAKSAASRLFGRILRALLRLAALLLTMLMISQITVVSMDLISAQCLGRTDSECLTGMVPDWLRESAEWRTALGLAPIALIMLVLYPLCCPKLLLASERKSGTELPVTGSNTALPAASVAADPDVPALLSLHTVAALASAALLTLGGPIAPAQPELYPWWLASLVLIGIAAAGALLLDDPGGAAPAKITRLLRRVLSVWPRRVLIAASAALLVGTVWCVPLAGALPGSNPTVGGIALLLGGCCALVGLFLVPAALLARKSWAQQPRLLRPWVGGWMAAPVLALAALLGGGVGAGLGYVVDEAIGTAALELPPGYRWITLLWGIAVPATVVIGFALVLLRLLARRLLGVASQPRKSIPDEVGLLHAERPQDALLATKAWRWAHAHRQHTHHMVVFLSALLCAGAIAALALRPAADTLPNWVTTLSGVGVVVLVALSGGLLMLVYLAARRPAWGKRLGVLADLASFWPREAHPAIPPCYAMKVVPEVAARAREHLADPSTRVVLVGHSQGSLLAAVAAARLIESLPVQDRERVGLVTAGSQLQWAYPRAFPAVVPHDSLAALAGLLQGRWRSLCRGSDSLGGAVSTWSRQAYDGQLLGVGFRSDGSTGPLPPAVRGPTGALVLGGDHWLPDPMRGPFPLRRWKAGVLGHNDYQVDPEWDRAVAIAAGLEAP